MASGGIGREGWGGGGENVRVTSSSSSSVSALSLPRPPDGLMSTAENREGAKTERDGDGGEDFVQNFNIFPLPLSLTKLSSYDGN